jgi:DNA helicase HerA-like ATPase
MSASLANAKELETAVIAQGGKAAIFDHSDAEITAGVTRIAREGRKYGVSLALISQRPSELPARAPSQCDTIFALRIANDLDQCFMAAN